MNDEIREYIAYLSKSLTFVKPSMPKFDIYAYTDNEYLNAIRSIMRDFDLVNDDLVARYLEGE